MLRAWVDFEYRIRLDCKTPGVRRELTILRTAQPTDSFEKRLKTMPYLIETYDKPDINLSGNGSDRFIWNISK
jgi:hypothetical protein